MGESVRRNKYTEREWRWVSENSVSILKNWVFKNGKRHLKKPSLQTTGKVKEYTRGK